MSADHSGRSLFIVDNSVSCTTGVRYLKDWACMSLLAADSPDLTLFRD